MKNIFLALAMAFTLSANVTAAPQCVTPGGVNEGQPIQVGTVGGSVYTNGAAHVAVSFCGGVAGYVTDGWLWGPDSEVYLGTVNGPSSGPMDIGAFAQGSEIIFRIYVRSTGQTYFSGSKSYDNPADSTPHAAVVDLGGNKFWIGFNDNHGNGDYDFNDVQFVVQIDTVNEICPCYADYKNHGEYVSCVAHAANAFVKLGVMSPNQKGGIVSQAGQSQCGKN